jgi:signal-transduction protein with cAMP-binding, CBS, and nucleotidyltransferase domain
MKTAEDIIKNKGHEMISVSSETPLSKAVEVMKNNGIGAILITKKEKIVGIWTERDLLHNCIVKGFNLEKDEVSKYMDAKLSYAEHRDNLYALQDKFLGRRLRHLLIRKEGRLIGIISSGDVMRAAMDEKDRELKDVNAMAGWEYYENWKWEKSKKNPVIHNQEGLRVDTNPV